jgi:glycosyltransferase involved in cell wall biosynthesis
MRNLSISVIIPMYNSQYTIENCIKSVLNQTYDCVNEIIVINDGSTDKSSQIVQKIAINESRIILITKENGGVSSARNTGMRKATSDYIAFIDSDDEWHPSKLQKQFSVLLNDESIDLISTNRNGDHFRRFFFKKFHHVTKISSRLLLYKTFCVTSSVIIKKSVIDNIGLFDESQRYAEEGNYYIRICKDNNCVLLNESLVDQGGGKPTYGFSGLSANLKEMEKGELKNLKLAKNINLICIIEYYFLICYSFIKYIKRILIVKLRKRC